MRRIQAVLFALALWAPRLAPADELPMTADEYALWKDYQDALDDERVQKLRERDRIPAIARNFKVAEKKLREAVKKGEAHGAEMAGLAEQRAREALAGTAVEKRIKELKVDGSKSHVVTYVTWQVDQPELIEEEASLIAVRCAKSAPLSSTASLRAVNGGDLKLFSALISREAARRIKEDRIPEFADTRFIKLFEKVERPAE